MSDDPSAVYRNTQHFLDEHEDGEAVVEEILAVDEQAETWEFGDIDLESGTFGEVVSTGVVEKVDGEYRVPDRDAVRSALAGEEVADTGPSETGFSPDIDLDYTRLGSLLSALLVVVLARIFYYRTVFVDGRVVSPGNDPYFFRYWQEQLAAASSGPLSFDVLVNPPWDDGSFNQRPLTHATNWWFTELLGGDQWAADMVTAWLPLVFTVLLAVVVYYLAVVLTDDYRVGVMSVLVLALAPVHANYTGLGLLHHRYNQYLWFGVILLTLAWLGTDITRRRAQNEPQQAVRRHLRQRTTWYVAVAFGLALAAWTHSWGGSPELFVGLGAFVGVRVCMDIRDGITPGLVNLPLVAGFGVGAGLAMTAHLALGWHGLLAPGLSVLLFAGVAGVVGAGELWHRRGLSPRTLLVLQPVLAVVGVAVALVAFDQLSAALDQILRSISSGSAPDWQISAQTESLYSTDLFVIFGPIAQIGLEFYVALAVLGWCLVYVSREYDPAWLLIGVLTVHYLVVAGIQVRFAGRLVIVMTVLGGLGVVFLLSALDLVRDPFPVRQTEDSPHRTGPTETDSSTAISSPRRSAMILVVCVMVFSVSLLFIPTLMSQVTHDSDHVKTAMEISEHADETGREYPDSRVLAPWGEYRLYNYFVSGESESEDLGRYAYPRLTRGADPDSDTFTTQAGYVVMTDLQIQESEQTDQLSAYLGLESDSFGSLERYQLLQVDRQANLAVFAIVPGATLELSGESGEEVALSTEISASGRTFTYGRTVVFDESGTASVRVPYPGTYDIGGTEVSVDARAVQSNQTIDVDQR